MPVFVTGITPAAATGLGPHPVTLQGSGFPLTPGSCQIVMKDSSGTTVGQSAAGTAASDVAFTAPVTFGIFTPTGPYIPYLIADGIGYAGAPAFTLTRNQVTIPDRPERAVVGSWYRDSRLPANRP